MQRISLLSPIRKGDKYIIYIEIFVYAEARDVFFKAFNIATLRVSVTSCRSELCSRLLEPWQYLSRAELAPTDENPLGPRK